MFSCICCETPLRLYRSDRTEKSMAVETQIEEDRKYLIQHGIPAVSRFTMSIPTYSPRRLGGPGTIPEGYERVPNRPTGLFAFDCCKDSMCNLGSECKMTVELAIRLQYIRVVPNKRPRSDEDPPEID